MWKGSLAWVMTFAPMHALKITSFSTSGVMALGVDPLEQAPQKPDTEVHPVAPRYIQLFTNIKKSVFAIDFERVAMKKL